jgi:hypothetical protein
MTKRCALLQPRRYVHSCRQPRYGKEVCMQKEEKPRHQLVMVCPACGTSFQPEVVGLHVRLCPQCEKEKSAYEQKFAGPLDPIDPPRAKAIYSA